MAGPVENCSKSGKLTVDKYRFHGLSGCWLFFVQFAQGHVLQGLQGLANNLSTEAPTDFVGNC
jgi:hypothetical protein